jgi:hypothetical protein
MTFVDWNDDDVLRRRLAEALREVDAVPPDFAEAGHAVLAWRDFEAELAALIYDSEHDDAVLARADIASLRALTFATSQLTIEVTFMPDVMIGQVVPQCPARISLRLRDGGGVDVVADRLGVFVVEPGPREPFVLSCQFGTGINVVTPLITP